MIFPESGWQMRGESSSSRRGADSVIIPINSKLSFPHADVSETTLSTFDARQRGHRGNRVHT